MMARLVCGMLRPAICFTRLPGHSARVASVAISPDGNFILSGSWDGTMRLWETETGRPVESFAANAKFTHPVAFSPDGRTIAAGTDDGDLILRKIETARTQATPTSQVPARHGAVPTVRTEAPTNAKAPAPMERTLTGHAGYVYSVSFSSDGRTLVSGSEDRTIRFWDYATGTQIRTIEGHDLGITAVRFLGGDQQILSGSLDDTIRLWDIATGRELRRFLDHTNDVNTIAVSSTPASQSLAEKRKSRVYGP